MENKLINIDDIIIRKATKDDNFEEIAELIYETDPYIYPHWFHNDVDECKKVIIPLLDKEGFFFNYKSMHLAINKKNNKIIGLIQVIDKDTNFDYDYTELMNKDRNYKFTIENYIFELINEVKESGLPYFSNIVNGSIALPLLLCILWPYLSVSKSFTSTFLYGLLPITNVDITSNE